MVPRQTRAFADHDAPTFKKATLIASVLCAVPTLALCALLLICRRPAVRAAAWTSRNHPAGRDADPGRAAAREPRTERRELLAVAYRFFPRGRARGELSRCRHGGDDGARASGPSRYRRLHRRLHGDLCHGCADAIAVVLMSAAQSGVASDRRRLRRDRRIPIVRAVPVGAWRSPVSALVWGTRGRGFKSRRPDHFNLRKPKLCAHRCCRAENLTGRDGCPFSLIADICGQKEKTALRRPLLAPELRVYHFRGSR